MAPAIPTHDYYVVLEVSRSATYKEIKLSYRRLARLHHPDKNAGSKSATAKIQLINEAWDVLKDDYKRSEYNRTYHASNPTTAPRSSWQPPQPGTTTQEDTRAQAESQRKRQQWLDWERIQEQNIRQCRFRIKILQAEIAALSRKSDVIRTKLAKDVPYWWNMLWSLSTRLSEAEKIQLRRAILDIDASIRIKQIPLDHEQTHMKRLEFELSQGRYLEKARLAAEFRDKERREKLAKARAEAEAQRRAAEEYARQQAAREAREKAAREEATRAETDRLKKVAEEWTARETAYKKWQEEAAERARAAYAEGERLQNLKRQQNTRNKNDERRRHPQNRSCNHRTRWDKVMGRSDCPHCTRPLFQFAFQCHRCESMACIGCMKALKAGQTPPTDYNDTGRQGKARPHRTKGKGRQASSQ